MTTPDETARRLYHWEDSFVEPKVPAEYKLLARAQCRDLVGAACVATRTRFPRVVFNTLNAIPCKADFREWTITLAEWGHAALPVLHECAHLATFDAVMRGENPHGPTFARQVIELYVRFLRIDRRHLESTAGICGLEVAEPRRPRGDEGESPFSDIDF